MPAGNKTIAGRERKASQMEFVDSGGAGEKGAVKRSVSGSPGMLSVTAGDPASGRALVACGIMRRRFRHAKPQRAGTEGGCVSNTSANYSPCHKS